MDVYLPPLLDVLHGLTVDLGRLDRKSTRLNSSHLVISYAVFCLKKKKKHHLSPSSRTHARVSPYNSSNLHFAPEFSLRLASLGEDTAARDVTMRATDQSVYSTLE